MTLEPDTANTLINPNIEFASKNNNNLDSADANTATSLLFNATFNGNKHGRLHTVYDWLRLRLFRRNISQRRQHVTTVQGRQRMRELVQYIIFLLILTYLVLYNRSFYYFRMKDAVDRTLLQSSFYGIGRVADLWSFLTGPLLDFLFSNADDGGAAKLVLHNSVLIGWPRIRQLRVPRTDCRGLHKLFPNAQDRAKFSTCYGEFESTSNNDHAPFGLCGNDNINSASCNSAWQYSEGRFGQLAAMFTGRFGYYPGGGYKVVLPLDTRQNAATVLDNLKTNYWLDRATRAVFIDFSLLNLPTSIFCVVRLLAEFSAGGLSVTRADFRVLKLLHGTGLSGVAGDTSWLNLPHAAQVVAWCFLLYYFYEEVQELVHGGSVIKHLQDFWNLLDIVMLGFAGAWAVLCIYVDSFVLPQVVQELKALEPDNYINLYDLAFHLEARGYAFAALNFVAWIKLFKYLSLNRATTTVFETLQEAGGDLASYLILFATVFLALAQFGYICFGSDIDHYSSTLNAWIQLFQRIIGNYSYDELHTAHFLLGPMYFIAFVFIVYCVLVNLFLSIISEKYTETEKKIAQRSPEENYELHALVSRTLRQWRVGIRAWYLRRRQKQRGLIAENNRQKVHDLSVARQLREPLSMRHRKIFKINVGRKQTVANNSKPVGSWKSKLKRRGYTEEEIKTVFGGTSQNLSDENVLSTAVDGNLRTIEYEKAFRADIFSTKSSLAPWDSSNHAEKTLALIVPRASPKQLALYEKIQQSKQKIKQLEYTTLQMEAYCREILLKLQVYAKYESGTNDAR